MCEQVTTAAGAAYFSQRPGWDSDISWVSVDDRPTYEGVMTYYGYTYYGFA